jgi:hypothetical protein
MACRWRNRQHRQRSIPIAGGIGLGPASEIDPMTADLFTGKDEIDREEALYLARKEAETEKHNNAGWFYRISHNMNV